MSNKEKSSRGKSEVDIAAVEESKNDLNVSKIDDRSKVDIFSQKRRPP